MIRITPTLSIAEEAIEETFLTATGPGGQHVNKTATAVRLRFDTRHPPMLPEDVLARLARIAGSRLAQDGTIIIVAQGYRSQKRNREDALDRLIDMIRDASVRPTRRRATRPTLASKERRLEAKNQRGTVKSLRRGPVVAD